MRDDLGYLDVSDYLDLNIEMNCSNNIYWLQNNNEEYLFKEENSLAAYKELFYSHLVQNCCLDSVFVDLARYKNNYGIISKNYNPQKLEVKSFYNIILEFLKCQKLRYTREVYDLFYNYDTVNQIIKWYCIEHQKNYREELKLDIFIHFVMQILLGDSDKTALNYELMFDKNPKLAPLFDFEKCGLVNLDKKSNELTYRLRFKRNDIEIKNDFQMFIHFLEYGTKEELEIFKYLLETIKQINIPKIINCMEYQINANVPIDIRRRLVNTHRTNIEKIDNIWKGKFD